MMDLEDLKNDLLEVREFIGLKDMESRDNVIRAQDMIDEIVFNICQKEANK